MCVNLYLTEVQKYVKYGMYENILKTLCKSTNYNSKL